MRSVHFKDLGQIDFKDAWDLQTSIFQTTIDQKKIKREGRQDVETVEPFNLLRAPACLYAWEQWGHWKHVDFRELSGTGWRFLL